MKVTKSDRGFQFLKHPTYIKDAGKDDRIVSQSSAIGPYDDAMDRPGSSFLWFGENHHLNREEVAEVVEYLKLWLKTGDLKKPPAR